MYTRVTFSSVSGEMSSCNAMSMMLEEESYINGYGFFLKKYSDSKCCWKKYTDFGGGKKKSDSEFLSYNLMLISGKTKQINILIKILNETKTIPPPPPPPLQVKWSVPNKHIIAKHNIGTVPQNQIDHRRNKA